MQAVRNEVGCKVRNMTHYGQPSIEISLKGTDGPRNTWVTSYSTMDTIEGNVKITATHDTRFEDIDIAFVGKEACRKHNLMSLNCTDILTGMTQVYVDTLSTTPSMTGRTEANHRFLVLRQPIAEEDFPSPRIFEAGRSYQFPFTFTVPTQLLPKSCSHKVSSDHVHDCHLMLPPSLGDPDLSGFGGTLLDDFAPDMSKINYMVKVRIAHLRGPDGIAILGEKSKKVRIKPALIEQPPLNIEGSHEYRPLQEKNVRKGLFKGRLGTLITRTCQPKALVIPGARTAGMDSITTMAKLLLRFDPAEESATPPKLGSLATKLKVSTYYASSPRQAFPSRLTIGFDVSQGAYLESVPLSTLCIASAHWEKHTSAANPEPADPLERRDSGISDCSALSSADAAFATGLLPASSNYKNGTFYTAQILVPVSLPPNKNFVPTFHSCLVSRTYTLALQFAATGGSALNLKVPVQICAEGSDAGIENARARSVEESAYRRHVDVHAPPSFEEVTGTQRSASVVREEMPPDYAAFAPPARRYRGSVETGAV
jgi:hypothetical protein